MNHQTMNTETTVQPGEETQNPSPESVENPSPDTPEGETPKEAAPAEQKPEKSEVERERERFQRRMDKRTADLYRERAEKESLAQRLAALESGEGRPEPAKDSDAQIEQRARQIAEAQAFNERCNKVYDEGKKLDGFQDAVKVLADEIPLFDRKGRPTEVMQVLMESEKPAALIHHLGKNPDVAAELADLTPTQLARRLDRIERDLTATPKPSKAPAPIEPIGSGKTPIVDLSSASMEDYIKLRQKQGSRWIR